MMVRLAKQFQTIMPRVPGTNIKLENIIVSIPKVEDRRDFVDKLKLAFRNNISGSKTLIF